MGDEYVKQANELLKNLGWLFGPSKQQLNIDAINSLKKAANYYIIDKEWSKTADVYKTIANLYRENKEFNNVAVFLTKAGDVIYHIDKEEAALNYKDTIKLFIEEGNFLEAAKNQKKIAEIDEIFWRHKEAIANYVTCLSYYEAINNTHDQPCNSSVIILVRLVELTINVGEYENAIIYMNKILRCKYEDLNKHNNQIIFDIMVCKFYLDQIDEFIIDMDKYCNLHEPFYDSPEYEALHDVYNAYMNKDDVGFMYAFIKIELLQWHIDVIIDIKNRWKTPKNNKTDTV
jgi:tetratricopeptide (TPR) repeat protein